MEMETQSRIGKAVRTKTRTHDGADHLDIPVLPLLIVSLIVLFLLSINLGRFGIPIDQFAGFVLDKTFGMHFSYPATIETVLMNIRIPRIFAAILVGTALSASGASYQGLFKNPMVSPDILGAAAGAGFGAALAILLSFNTVGIQISAFAFGLLAVMLSYLLSRAIGKGSNVILILVLTGIVMESMFAALTSAIKYVADPDSKLPEITFWLMGSLSRLLGMGDILKLLIPVGIGILPLYLLRWKINVLSFGEEEAIAMGVNTKRLRLVIIACSTLLTACAISVSGMVGWVGLVVPHISRMLVGPNYKKLLPVSMVTGGIFLLAVDDVARSAISIEIPLGILTALIGAPFFVFLLLRGKKGWL
ncbi:FecCD family ABC transporter permease [Ethanoligenens harbinense]|uniref:Transport system permease protein n=1 Tax=Ethanoligenens harbinense (strain DSM 18485 / JCM 12961 / CGMCC 1.5033 / YUAN-3) TaxID=663278 RepID=E6U4T4_ETHHY|nr:iron ABC transporter permease [Ethanoligenens harbinense]ADU27819.1 transport system permease protein [Ethanoligenens harbinense YUAN-3]